MKEKINKTIENLLKRIDEETNKLGVIGGLPELVEATAILINISRNMIS